MTRPGHKISSIAEARRNMLHREQSSLFAAMIGQVVVVDLRSTYVCLGTLVSGDDQFLEMVDADFHDFRDSTATREIYVYESARYGIRRNRAQSSCARMRLLRSAASPTSLPRDRESRGENRLASEHTLRSGTALAA